MHAAAVGFRSMVFAWGVVLAGCQVESDSGADADPPVDTEYLVEAFQAEAGGRLDQLERRLDAAPARTPAEQLGLLRQRHAEIAQRLRDLTWRSPHEWRVATGQIEGDLDVLRRDLDRVSRSGP